MKINTNWDFKGWAT